MSDGLREALEKLCAEYESGHASSKEFVFSTGTIRDLLAAHPVEPATESTANEDEWKCAHCGDTIDLYGDDLQWRSTGDFGDTGSGAGTSARWCEDGPSHEHSPVRGIAEGGGITERLSAALGLTNEGDDPFRRDVIRALEPEIQRIISERTGGGITDEAVEAAYAAYVGDMGVSLHEGLKNALEAAAPLLGLQQVPTVLLDREAVRALFRGPNACGYWLENLMDDYEQEAATDAVMELAQQVPTREEIELVLLAHMRDWREDGSVTCKACGYADDQPYGWPRHQAEVVLALFSKPAGPQCTCEVDDDVTVEMRTETGQHLMGCPLSRFATPEDAGAES